MGLCRILPEEVQVGFSPLKLLTRVVYLRGDVCPSYCLIGEGGRERELPLEKEKGRKGDGGKEKKGRRRRGGQGRRGEGSVFNYQTAYVVVLYMADLQLGRGVSHSDCSPASSADWSPSL